MSIPAVPSLPVCSEFSSVGVPMCYSYDVSTSRLRVRMRKERCSVKIERKPNGPFGRKFRVELAWERHTGTGLLETLSQRRDILLLLSS